MSILNAIRSFQSKRECLPESIFAWKNLLSVDDIFASPIRRFLTINGANVFEISTEHADYTITHITEKEAWGHSENSEISLSPKDILAATFNKDLLANELSESLGFERTPVEKLNSDTYYLGILPKQDEYSIFLCFDFKNFESILKVHLPEGRIPIVYYFTLLDLSRDARKIVEHSRGKFLCIADSFEIGERKLKCLKTLDDILGYRLKFKGENATHTEFRLGFPEESARAWGMVSIFPDGNEYVKIAYANQGEYSLCFRDIEAFRIGQPPTYKASALWKFFQSTLFQDGSAFNSNDNSSDSKNRKLITQFLKHYFRIQKPPYRAANGILFPQFNTLKSDKNKTHIRHDKRHVSFDERYHH